MFRRLKMIKKSLFVLPLILMFAGISAAQGVELAKNAERSLLDYTARAGNTPRLDRVGGWKTQLVEAKQLIDEAFKYPDARQNSYAWRTKGDIYLKIIENMYWKEAFNIPLEDFNNQFGPAPNFRENDDLEAFDANKKAFDLTTKKFEKTDALNGIRLLMPHLIRLGNEAAGKQRYDKAYLLLESALQGYDIAVQYGPVFGGSEKESHESLLRNTLMFALQAKRFRDALPRYENIIKTGTNDPEIYLGLFTIKNELGDTAGAEQIVLSGQKKFPNDSGLLFAMINLFLKQGKLDEIVEPLQQAIAREPNNIGLYTTLGSVYDKLLTRERESGNAEAETQYFGEAEKIYRQALEKAPRDSDALYSLGSLYYNKAALLSKVEQTDDVVTEIMALFDQALPYFQKAESVNANDQSALGALFGIYSSKQDGPLTAEFKRRLETVQRGGKNASSYFK